MKTETNFKKGDKVSLIKGEAIYKMWFSNSTITKAWVSDKIKKFEITSEDGHVIEMVLADELKLKK